MNQQKNKPIQRVSPNKFLLPHKINALSHVKGKFDSARTYSPLSQFVNNQSDELQLPKAQSKQMLNLKYCMQPLTPQIPRLTPDYNQTRSSQATPQGHRQTQKRVDTRIQKQKYLDLNSKNSKIKESYSYIKPIQKNSISNNSSVQNYSSLFQQENQSKCTSFYQILREKDAQLNTTNHEHQDVVTAQCIYGMKSNIPQTARDNYSLTIQQKKQQNKNQIYSRNSILDEVSSVSWREQSQQNRQSNLNDDDKDLFYQIIKQRTIQDNSTLEDSQGKDKKQIIQTYLPCIIHQNREALYYSLNQNNHKIFQCCNCAIQSAFDKSIIYQIENDKKICQTTQTEETIEEINFQLSETLRNKDQMSKYEEINFIEKDNKQQTFKQKQVCISFENKDQFFKKSSQIDNSLIEYNDEPDLLRTEDSIVLKSNETQQFLQYLKKDSMKSLQACHNITNIMPQNNDSLSLHNFKVLGNSELKREAKIQKQKTNEYFQYNKQNIFNISDFH